MTESDLISDERIEEVHGNANFGDDLSKRDVVRLGVLKCASGYLSGYTSRKICEEHGLIGKGYRLTQKGQQYLWAAFSKGSNF